MPSQEPCACYIEAESIVHVILKPQALLKRTESELSTDDQHKYETATCIRMHRA